MRSSADVVKIYWFRILKIFLSTEEGIVSLRVGKQCFQCLPRLLLTVHRSGVDPYGV
jgi:hypothetical protein